MSSPSVANRGSAEQCILKARAAGKAGDLALALRLLDKSMRLFATDEARVLHSAYTLRLERQKEMPTNASSSQSNAKEKAAQTHGPVKGSYSADEQKLASNILKTNGYYERLGVAKNASQDEIKKAYRKKAFKFHPDKNHAPSAGDAFKALNEAYECLSNPEKKAIYDQYGTEQAPSPHYRNADHPFGGGFHGQQDFTPEDILNMFFNGNARMRRRQHAQHPRPAHAPASSYAQLFQFVPLLLMILFSMWSGPTSEEKPFRLLHDRTYSVERKTPSGTPYFVNSDFVRWYTRDRRALARVEALVEESNMRRLRELCKSEKKKRARAIYTAKKSNAENQSEILQAAYSMTMPSCTRLEGIYSQS